jgi:integrative and conjugative element protein (TIGR02256 family)
MQQVSTWGTADLRLLVSINELSLSAFERHVQHLEADPESGGILLGCVRGPHLEVLEASTPTKWDRRFRYFFERLPFGHQLLADEKWTKSSGTVRYLGEWHTHPEDDPSPSSLDRSEWQKQAARRKDGRSTLSIIVGRHSLHVELVARDGTGIKLQRVE